MHNNKWEGAGGGRRRGEGRRRRRRWDHYLSAPGREAATFGRGGGAGGFELNYRTKTKKKKTQMTQIQMEVLNKTQAIPQGEEHGWQNG